MDIQEFYELTLMDESKSTHTKTSEALQMASRWEVAGPPGTTSQQLIDWLASCLLLFGIGNPLSNILSFKENITKYISNIKGLLREGFFKIFTETVYEKNLLAIYLCFDYLYKISPKKF